MKIEKRILAVALMIVSAMFISCSKKCPDFGDYRSEIKIFIETYFKNDLPKDLVCEYVQSAAGIFRIFIFNG